MPPEKPSGNDSPTAKVGPARRLSGLQLLQSTSVVSAMTLMSRILGLVRDVVFARFFGATIVMDAFIVANRIPNMLRRFFAEGAFSQGFVPVMARYKENGDHAESRELVDAVAGTLGLILFLVSLIGVIAAPLLVRVRPAVVAPPKADAERPDHKPAYRSLRVVPELAPFVPWMARILAQIEHCQPPTNAETAQNPEIPCQCYAFQSPRNNRAN